MGKLVLRDARRNPSSTSIVYNNSLTRGAKRSADSVATQPILLRRTTEKRMSERKNERTGNDMNSERHGREITSGARGFSVT